MTNEPIYKGVQILDFIPQRPPFLLIDSVYEVGENKVTTGFSIPEDHVLCDGGKLMEGGLVENIAQSAALYAGSGFKSRGEDVPLGYIAMIKNLTINDLPEIKQQIFTSISFEKEVMNMQIVHGTVHDASGNPLASCELRIFISNNG